MCVQGDYPNPCILYLRIDRYRQSCMFSGVKSILDKRPKNGVDEDLERERGTSWYKKGTMRKRFKQTRSRMSMVFFFILFVVLPLLVHSLAWFSAKRELG